MTIRHTRYIRAGLVLALVLSVVGILAAQTVDRPPVNPPALREYPVLKEKRMELLKEYARVHFGIESTELAEPKMIVVHFTAMSGLTDSLATFKPDVLPKGRTDIAGHGDVNVGIHYLIAKDGTVYRLQPENVIGRHTIGFNWCAIGIEMVAKNEKELTDAELSSCAELCAWIASRHPSIKYLIGHHEYMKKDLPHFALYLEKDLSYKPTDKIDPGDAFMKRLRQTLAARYALSLKE
jgi:N-acetyl-anhydromuramyl-L-alanine amidase AmpD